MSRALIKQIWGDTGGRVWSRWDILSGGVFPGPGVPSLGNQEPVNLWAHPCQNLKRLTSELTPGPALPRDL